MLLVTPAKRVGRAAPLGAELCLNGNTARLISTSIVHEAMNLLNAAGAEGWELVGITSNNMAYLKREVEEVTPMAHTDETRSHERPNGRDAGDGRAEVKVKYRDPVTNETWSGRGRMASWLKRKQEAGEDIEEYLV
jgi:DNA-binding protein H-NS